MSDLTTRRRYACDTRQRRKRGHRTPTGRRVRPQPRDPEILKILTRYRYARSTFLWQLLPPAARGRSFKRFQDRLTTLFHETNTPHGGAYLDWPREQELPDGAHHWLPAIFELSRAGESYLAELGVANGYKSELVSRGRMGAIRQFPHAMMICDTLQSIEIGVRGDPQVRFISWEEIIARAPESTRTSANPFRFPKVRIAFTFPRGKTEHAEVSLIPDGLFGLEYALPDGSKRYRFFALEAEHKNAIYRSNLTENSFLKKALAYRKLSERPRDRDGKKLPALYAKHLGIPNLMVMVVTPTKAKAETMKALIVEIARQDGRTGSEQFIFQAIPALGHVYRAPPPMPQLFTTPWPRAGYPDFDLSKP